ncbi:alginate lyase family protein [Cohnella fermenti]|nr:alginate lyase family protein [Cohnella fermenti]
MSGYKELRLDPRYTKPQPTDAAFLAGELKTDKPELADVRRHLDAKEEEQARNAFLKRFEDGSIRRYYYGVHDVPSLMETARNAYGDSADAKETIREADLIAAGSIPTLKGRLISFKNGEYRWNDWFYDSSQYQLQLVRFAYTKSLSRAYALTGDEKYAECFDRMMSHFIDDNPAPLGDAFRVQHNTWEPLSVGVRMFQLPEAFITFFASPSFRPETKMKLIKSFAEHARYVRKYHADHGNHACMQLRGLITIALLLPELKEAEEWLAYGLRELPAYIRQNVYPDGAQFEGSPNYHIVVMRDLYELVTLLRAVGMDEKEYTPVLERMYELLHHLMAPDISLPKFGDTGDSSESDLRDIMSLGAYLFERPDYKHAGKPSLPYSLLWRLGPGAIERYERIPSAPSERTAACFPVGGYLISRESWERDAMYLAMRAGIGIAGHAHSDALSVIVYTGGKELIADSGIGLFEWNKERKHIVSTRAHNTVVVDGQDQHVRSMHWSTPPSASCKIWDFRPSDRFDYQFASHFGYTRYEDPVIHSRKTLFIKNRCCVIVDLFEAKERHRYEQLFHLPRGEAIYVPEARQIRTNARDANVLIAYAETAQQPNDAPISPDLLADELGLTTGLLFEKGDYHRSPVATRTLVSAGRTELAAVILPYRGAEAPRIAVRRLPVMRNGCELAPHEATGLLIEGEGWRDAVCLYHDHIAVDAYLDHTGNPVEASLLPAPAGIDAFEFAGGTHTDDVIVKSYEHG